jgi:cysteine desulfurase / selenocysteine lyase
MRRIYLDNAATSWPKPTAVYDAVDRYLRENGAPAGRGTYSQAVEVERAIASGRAAIARLIGAADAKQIIFTSNGTEALNLAIHGLLRPGDHAICTCADHNSVLRPLRQLEEHGQVEVTRVKCDAKGLVDPGDLRRALKSNTKLIAILHASNVTGVIEPVAEIGRIVRSHGARFLVDAAQSLGHVHLSVDEMQADLLAAPGHKGLLGPLGTGVLYVRPGLESQLQSLRQGGTGSRSDEDRQPETVPDKFEAGNHNVPGLVGLAAASRWLESKTVAAIQDHEQHLARRLRTGLKEITRITLHGCSETSSQSLGVVSISIAGYDPQEAAALLDVSFGVQVRAGLHCAPLVHRALGTSEVGGTVRFSLGAFNTAEDVDAAIAAMREIARGG